MKNLGPAPTFLLYAVFRALRHPRTPIVYYYCPSCNIRFNAKESECPKCHDKVEGSSPDPRQESPIPWWGSIAVIIVGVIVCILAAYCKLPTLDRVGDALVFIPLGNLFGMSLKRT